MRFMKDFDAWNRQKKHTESQDRLFFQEREIWFIRLGENVGFEQCGKGSKFLRPILVFKKFNNQVFWGIPLSKTKKRGKYYFPFQFKNNVESCAIITQLRLFDAKRLKYKHGMMRKNEFVSIKKAIQQLL